jgi:hypothetical protein
VRLGARLAEQIKDAGRSLCRWQRQARGRKNAQCARRTIQVCLVAASTIQLDIDSAPPMSPHRRPPLPLLALLALLLLALGVSACGYESHSKEVEEGQSVELGELKYNVTFSRYLNPNDPEDEAYLVGQEEAPKGETYFGVFFEVQNESDKPQALPPSVKITDVDDNEYEVLESESIFALPFGGTVEAEEQIPRLDTPAQQGSIEGALTIFLLPEAASENRPLTLHIPAPEGEEGAEVTLDL